MDVIVVLLVWLWPLWLLVGLCTLACLSGGWPNR